ncbi:hypothetical protein D3C77_460040 [compost metagenome]
MEYFQIRQDDRAENSIIPQLPVHRDIWKEVQPIFLPAKARNSKGYIHFLPFIEKPLQMVSDPVKRIIEMYQSKMLFKPCAVGNIEQKKVEVYWFMKPRVIECLHGDTMYYPDGTLKEIYLSEAKIGFNKVFQVDCKRGEYLIIDSEVLERLFREGIHAFKITPVKVM